MSARDASGHQDTRPARNARTEALRPGFELRDEGGDGYLRRRFAGRGRQGGATDTEADRLDVRLALSELRAAEQMLARLEAMPHGRERREAYRETVAKIALAGRALDDLVIRRGGELS